MRDVIFLRVLFNVSFTIMPGERGTLNHVTRFLYTSMLAYIVDSNTGRSSTAVAVNSFFRGVSAFIGTEIAVPIQVCSSRH